MKRRITLLCVLLVASAAGQFVENFGEQQQLIAADAQSDDEFGFAVSIYENTIAVGAWTEDTGGADAGAAYIFTRSGTTWTQQQKIQASDVQAGDRFGGALAIDQDTLIVGSRTEDTGGADAGAAYIFTRSGTTWTQQQKIQASNAGAADQFGYSVGISGDTVIVGAILEDTGGNNAGAAYIFTRSGTTWTQQQQLVANDPDPADQFGRSVAIYQDTVIVGASEEDTTASGAGAAYIFTRSGTTWTQQQKIQASNAGDDDQFGEAVAIFQDTVIVGALFEDTGGADAGAAYIFTRSGTTWTQQQQLVANDPQADDNFGATVALAENTAIVGSELEDTGGADAGAAYIFTRSGTTWTQQQKIQASNAGAADQFGISVAINGDTALVGANFEDTGASNAGAAYVFQGFINETEEAPPVPGVATADPLLGDQGALFGGNKTALAVALGITDRALEFSYGVLFIMLFAFIGYGVMKAPGAFGGGVVGFFVTLALGWIPLWVLFFCLAIAGALWWRKRG